MCCRVSNFLCIGDLRLATLVVAVLSLLGNVGVLACTGWCIKLTRQILLDLLQKGGTGENDLLLVRSIRVALAILAVILVLSFAAALLDIVLFFGAIRRRRDMVQSWSHGHALVSGAYLLYFWVILVGCFANGTILYGFIMLCATAIGTVVTVYFWIVVRSYDRTLNRTDMSTVSGSCSPSSNNSHFPGSSAASARRDNDKTLPPYSAFP